MARIQIGGAGGAPSNNFIRSLRESKRRDYLIGTSSKYTDLFMADTDEKYVIPPASSPDYQDTLLRLIRRMRPDFVHVQNDLEVIAISRMRKQLVAERARLFLPNEYTIEVCVDKSRSHQVWKNAGVKVPESALLKNAEDLKLAFREFGPKIWVRATIGAGGRWALPTDSYEFGRLWIDHFQGWGQVMASRHLTSRSITWLSIWHEGQLIVAQTRRRLSWNFAGRTLSGVTGITGVAETCSDDNVNSVAIAAIRAIDDKPHGVFGVDMTYDEDGWPNPTEINIGRFFTTVYFFTKAGLNLPEIYCNIALDGTFPALSRIVNPLPDGLVWIRGMDVEPVLANRKQLEEMEQAWP